LVIFEIRSHFIPRSHFTPRPSWPWASYSCFSKWLKWQVCAIMPSHWLRWGSLEFFGQDVLKTRSSWSLPLPST
jgi:hypothetical protein